MKWFEEKLFATKQQELLLQAAILKGSDSIDAWQEWKSRVDVEGNHDSGSFRLLPLLYKNLQRHGIRDPFIAKLKGIYRKAWYKNQTLFYDVGKMIRYFHDAGIKTMLLKGASLTVLYYKNYGVRPMSDIDVLVPGYQASSAVDLLHHAGWKPVLPFKKVDLVYRHSCLFKDQSGTELDLHWRPFMECQESSWKNFWDKAVPLPLADTTTLSPNATDMLFHVIIHGVQWNLEPPIRWVADAMSVINCSDAEIDWMHLINQAEKQRTYLRVREGLNYLQSGFQARIPKSIMDTMNCLQASPLERVEYRCDVRNPKTWLDASFALFMSAICRGLRLNNGSRLVPTIVGLLNYLQHQYDVKDHYRLFPVLLCRLIKKAVKRIIKYSYRPNDSQP
jgi:hypothetical protein